MVVKTTNLSVMPKEQGTIVINCTLLDEQNNEVVPYELSYILSDKSDRVIKEDTITPDSNITIVFTGDDLALTEEEQVAGSGVRYLTLKGRYNSSVGGGLHLVDSCKFDVLNTSGIQ